MVNTEINGNFRKIVVAKMEENDRPQTDAVDQFQENADIGLEFIRDEEEDVHVCKKCNLHFYDLQKYLEHKVKHDHFKVEYRRSNTDRRMIMPKLVQKAIKKEPVENGETGEGEGKENEQLRKRGRRGKRKRSETHNQDLVITETPAYACEKCDRKFRREATLRRHIQYDHNEDTDDEEMDETLDDDGDKDYAPTVHEIKEEAVEAARDPEPPDMDSLQQVIMAAEMMEKAEQGAGSGSMGAESREGATGVRIMPCAAKRQRLSEEEQAARKFACVVCGSKFREVSVLKAHMVTHSNKRDFTCNFEGCSYSFKTKGSLKRHSRRHTGERPYPCELCGRTFTESGSLTRHLKSRTPCSTKTDNDLPRYGKKWTYTPNIPATMYGNKSLGDAQVDAVEAQKSDISLQHVNKDMMIQVSEVTIEPDTEPESEDTLTSVNGVVQVLTDSLQEEQEKHLFDLEQDERVEVVISGDCIAHEISDEGIAQFVETETEDANMLPTTCRVCKENFVSVEAVKIHLRTHLADDSGRCWLCHFVAGNKQGLDDHMYKNHNIQIKDSDPFNPIPLDSDQGATVKAGRESHMDAQIAVKQLLEYPEELGDEIESGELGSGSQVLYKCPVCKRKFRGANYLKLHMRSHTGLKPHKCHQCEKSFITKDTLKKHVGTHVEDRHFKCGECGKLFKRLSHVREHLKIHSASRPFSCSICEKTFKTNNAMKVHLRIHTNIMPYECNYCHRRFREKGSLLRHTRMHTGEKPYQCKYCGRGFSEHGTLNRHLKAKVSCTKQLQDLRDASPEDDMDYTVLNEFSSVVADTQQYMVPEGEDGLHDAGELSPAREVEQAAEFVLVQTNAEGEQIQNVEIITDGNSEQSMIEGVQVTEDYIVITEANGGGMRILDSKTGETVAIVPSTNLGEVEGQTITMTGDGDISSVTYTTENDMQPLIADGSVLDETIDEEQAAEVIHSFIETDNNQIEPENVINTSYSEQVSTSFQSETAMNTAIQSETGIDSCVQSEIGIESSIQSEAGIESSIQSEAGIESSIQSEADIESSHQSETGIESSIPSERCLEISIQSEVGIESSADMDSHNEIVTIVMEQNSS